MWFRKGHGGVVERRSTKIFDIDSALVSEAGVVDGWARGIGYEAAIAAFCNFQAMDGSVCFAGYCLVKLRGGIGCSDGNFLRELLNWIS